MAGDSPRERAQSQVDAVFERLVTGTIGASAPVEQSGWEMALPTGRVVARSTLQAEAQPLIALGPPAIPSLLRWARNEQLALRYVAVFALEQITGEESHIPSFAPGHASVNLDHALSAWWRWYESRAP